GALGAAGAGRGNGPPPGGLPRAGSRRVLTGHPHPILPSSRTPEGRPLKLKLPERSLFAILLRSPWWISIAIAGGLIVAASALLPAQYASLGVFAALPFIVIGAIAGWKQLRAPSSTRVAATIETLRAMSWSELADALEAAYRDDGHVVTRLADKGADFELQKAGKSTLLAARRWKVARTGIEPLRELAAAREARDARECLYV